MLASFYGAVVKPLAARLRGDRSFRRAKEVRAFYSLGAEAMRRTAFERLRAMLVHARETCAFHGERMAKAGFDPAAMRSAEELAAVPPLTRADVAEHAEDLVSSAYRREDLVEVRTGGTTSEPVPFFQDPDAPGWKDGAALVLRERLGWGPGVKSAFLWGAAQDLPPGALGALKRWRLAVRHRWVNRALYLPAADLSDAMLDRHAEALRRFRPRALQGYPTATDLLARRLLERGETLPIPLVLLTAEPALPAQRERIARAFGAEVLGFYGSRECGWIASECRKEKRLHVNVHGVHLETAPGGGLLVTDLVNRGMPLIRYEIGDLGRVGKAPCPCGDPRPVLESLEGRLLDVFVLPSGRRVPGVIPDVRGIQQDALGVLDAQIVQNEVHTLDVHWIPGPNFHPEHLDAFRRHLDEIFFHELTITMHRTDRIAPEPNGKVRHCISRVGRST